MDSKILSLFRNLEDQENKVEEFGKRMSLKLQSNYQEYIKKSHFELKGKNEKITEYATATKECECKKKIEEQEFLINTLRVRLEELNQNVEELNKNFKRLDDKLQNKQIMDNKRKNNNNIEDIKSFNERDDRIKSDETSAAADSEIGSIRNYEVSFKDYGSLKQDERITPIYTITMDEIIKKYITKINMQDHQQK